MLTSASSWNYKLDAQYVILPVGDIVLRTSTQTQVINIAAPTITLANKVCSEVSISYIYTNFTSTNKTYMLQIAC